MIERIIFLMINYIIIIIITFDFYYQLSHMYFDFIYLYICIYIFVYRYFFLLICLFNIFFESLNISISHFIYIFIATASRATQTGSVTVKANIIDLPNPEIINIITGRYKADHMITIVNSLHKYLNSSTSSSSSANTSTNSNTNGLKDFEGSDNKNNNNNNITISAARSVSNGSYLANSSSNASLHPSGSTATLHPIVRQILYIHIEATAENIHQFHHSLEQQHQQQQPFSPANGGRNSPLKHSAMNPTSNSFKESSVRDSSGRIQGTAASYMAALNANSTSNKSGSLNSFSHKNKNGILTAEQLLNPAIYPWLELPCLLVELMNAELSISFGSNNNNGSSTYRNTLSSKSAQSHSYSVGGSGKSLGISGTPGLEIDIFVPIVSQDNAEILRSSQGTALQSGNTAQGNRGGTGSGLLRKDSARGLGLNTAAAVAAISTVNDNSWTSRRTSSPRHSMTEASSTGMTPGTTSDSINTSNSINALTETNADTASISSIQIVSRHRTSGGGINNSNSNHGSNMPITPHSGNKSHIHVANTLAMSNSQRERDYEVLALTKFNSTRLLSNQMQSSMSAKSTTSSDHYINNNVLLTLDETSEMSKAVKTVQNLRILIIEENPVLARMRQRMLQLCLRGNSRTKFTSNVVITVTYHETLELCEKEHGRFDVVLVSHKIPTGVPTTDGKPNNANNNGNNNNNNTNALTPLTAMSVDTNDEDDNIIPKQPIHTGYDLVKKLRDGEGTREKMTNVVIIGCINTSDDDTTNNSNHNTDNNNATSSNYETQLFHSERFRESGVDSIWIEPFQSIDKLIQDIAQCRIKKLGVGAQLPGNKKLLLVGHVPSTLKMFTNKLKKVLPTSWRIDGLSELEKIKSKLLDRQIYYDIIIANEGEGVLGSEFFRSMRSRGHLGLLIGFSAGDNEKKFRECGADLFWSKLNNNSSDVYISYFLKEESLSKINAPRPIELFMKKVEKYYETLNDASMIAAAYYNEMSNPYKDRLKARGDKQLNFHYETKAEQKKRKNDTQRLKARMARNAATTAEALPSNSESTKNIETDESILETEIITTGTGTADGSKSTATTSITTVPVPAVQPFPSMIIGKAAPPPTQPPPVSSAVASKLASLSLNNNNNSNNNNSNIIDGSTKGVSLLPGHTAAGSRSASNPTMGTTASSSSQDTSIRKQQNNHSPSHFSDSALNTETVICTSSPVHGNDHSGNSSKRFSTTAEISFSSKLHNKIKKSIKIKEPSEYTIQVYQPNYPASRFNEVVKFNDNNNNDDPKKSSYDKEAESKWYEGYSYGLDPEGKGTGGGYMLGYGTANDGGKPKKETFPIMKRKSGRRIPNEDDDEGDY